jgi:hypothetical protein
VANALIAGEPTTFEREQLGDAWAWLRGSPGVRPRPGRVLVAGSLLWGVILDGSAPTATTSSDLYFA